MNAFAPRAFRYALRCALLTAVIPVAACGDRGADASGGIQGNPERGRLALTQYACHACHKIPGVTGSDVFVGPPLKGIAGRKFIAGRLPNTADNLVRWIRDPKQVDPLTAMPMLGVTEADANDMTAYLLSMD
jgi:cytochrome c2